MRRLTKPRRKPTLGSPAEFATEPLKLGGSSGRYDLPTVEADPDMLVDARIAATAGTYGALRITDLALHAELAPGRLVLHDMSLGLVGGKAKVWASAEPAGNGTRVSANAAKRSLRCVLRPLVRPRCGLTFRSSAVRMAMR